MRRFCSTGKKRSTKPTRFRNARSSAWCKSSLQSSLRPLRIEFLEERALLSMTTPLTAAQQSALVSGLAGLSQWTGQLITYAQLVQQLPLVGGTLGSLANVSTGVQALETQLATLLPGLTSTPATPNQIVADLQSISTTVGSLSVSIAPNSAVGSEASVQAIMGVSRPTTLISRLSLCIAPSRPIYSAAPQQCSWGWPRPACPASRSPRSC